ncbi:MAG: hypothetical protein AAB738_01385 [Patescibacteria group bacterium]|mgnify:CR=1 FL=1
MNKKTSILILVGVVLVLGIWLLGRGGVPASNTATPNGNTAVKSDPLNTTYQIEGTAVTLVNGKSEVEAAPGSATKIVDQVFGQPVFGDLNNDGVPDAGLILVDQPGGTGTFYYLAAAINQNGNYVGTNAILLGDRIAPQNIQIQNGVLITNYADRNPGEPFSVQPSVGKSFYARMSGNRLIETENIQGTPALD